MAEATQFNPDELRVALDHGEVVELDGGTLVVDGEECPSVVLRLAPWRARSVARALEEWSAVSRLFAQPRRPGADELDLSRTLELAAAVLGEEGEALLRFLRGEHTVPSVQRLAAVAVLAEREAGLSAVQRLALVDAAAWWLTDPAGGQELAHALIDGACADRATVEHVYLALITPPDHTK
jgi:phytoene dehydrogenase-like protein